MANVAGVKFSYEYYKIILNRKLKSGIQCYLLSSQHLYYFISETLAFNKCCNFDYKNYENRHDTLIYLS